MRDHFLTLVGMLVLLGAVRAEEWKFDVVHLKNGERFEGMIVEDTKDGLHFKYVIRKPGILTAALETIFARDEIAKIERLGEAARTELAQRLARLDPRGEIERNRMKALTLENVAWPGGGKALQYHGVYFSLLSNAKEEIVRQVVVRLEDIFQAYVERLGKRRDTKQPTRMVLFRGHQEYQAHLQGAGLTILNPAYYDPLKNLIVAASDQERLTEELDKLRRKHDGMMKDLEQQEGKLRKHFHGNPPAPMLAQVRHSRRSLESLNAENEATLERLTRPLFTTLFHEAFHAYIDNFVYPTQEGGLPHWLNEGLAQVFETALVETGDLRVGHVDLKRLIAVQYAIKQKRLRLADVLRSQPRDYQVAHRSDAQASDQHFLSAWALAYYLTFGRKLLNTEEMNQYVRALHRGMDRSAALQELVKQPLPSLEGDFQEFMLKLRPDGTLKSAPKP